MKKEFFRRLGVRGFTMVELIVSMAIMMMTTTLLLYNYPESAVRISLINSLHSVSLLVREAQVRGSAIDSVNSSLGGYGVQIIIPDDKNTASEVILFGDSISGTTGTISSYGLPIGNGLYETFPIDETTSVTTLPSRYSITKLCVGQAPTTCTSAVGSSITISFTRPSALPNIYLNDLPTKYSKACIEIQSPKAPEFGHTRSVEVYNSGMIRTSLSGCS